MTILCEEEADALRIAVEDDGVGFDGYQIDESDPTHVGLSNVRRRIRLYYGERGDVLIESPPCGGARVVMRIPFQPDE